MQLNNSLFKRKVLAFTLMQVALLSFLLIVSVVVRIILYPHNYLESLPLYFIVGFFFVWEMLDFFFMSKEIDAAGKLQGALWMRFLMRLLVSLAAGCCISLFLSRQFWFTGVLFLIFLVAELIFDAFFYRTVFRR